MDKELNHVKTFTLSEGRSSISKFVLSKGLFNCIQGIFIIIFNTSAIIGVLIEGFNIDFAVALFFIVIVNYVFWRIFIYIPSEFVVYTNRFLVVDFFLKKITIPLNEITLIKSRRMAFGTMHIVKIKSSKIYTFYINIPPFPTYTSKQYDKFLETMKDNGIETKNNSLY